MFKIVIPSTFHSRSKDGNQSRTYRNEVNVCETETPTVVSASLVDDGGMVNLGEVEYLTPNDMDHLLMPVTRPGGTTDIVVPEISQVGQVVHYTVYLIRLYRLIMRIEI
jgi:hypothetical protein